KSVLKNLRLLRSLHFMLMIFFGNFFSYDFEIFNSIIGMIVIFLAWQFNVIINDIYDVEIDKMTNKERPLIEGVLTVKSYKIIAIVFLSISVIICCSFLGMLSLIFLILYVLSGYFYSAPPLRLRNRIFATVFIGFWSLMAFYIGFFSSSSFIQYREFVLSILILSALSLGTVVKDYKDYEGDKLNNINTIFTKYGLETGSKICSIFLLITFLIPLFLIYHFFDFLIIIPLAITTVLFFNWKKNAKKVEITFLFYFIEIAYVFLRYTSIIIY
ncbi:MAG: UbiA family prenyltransferase, partial [Candidatus Helarchaeota archaeon]